MQTTITMNIELSWGMFPHLGINNLHHLGVPALSVSKREYIFFKSQCVVRSTKLFVVDSCEVFFAGVMLAIMNVTASHVR